MPGKEKPSAPMVQCCGAVKDKGGSYKRCGKTKMRHRLPEGLFTHGTMLEGTVCNSCYRFVMRCSQREKQNHAKCCNGPIPAHRERLEAFHLPHGMRFAVLDQPVPRLHVPASAIPPAMRRTHSDIGAAANARRLAVKIERSFSAGAAARATAHVGRHSHSCAGAPSPSTPRRPRCFSVGDGTGQSPRMPKRARTLSFHDSVGAGGGACSSPVRRERVSAPSSEWASRVGSTASEGTMEGDWSPSSSSSSAGALTGLAQPSFRFTGAPAARQAAGARAAATDTFDLDMDVGLDSDIDDDASILRELFDDVLDSGLGDDEPGLPASSSQIAGSDSRSHNHPSQVPAAPQLNLQPPPAFVRRPVVTVAAAVGHFAAPAQVVVPPAGAAVADVVSSSFANSDPTEHVFITASDVPQGQGGFGISNIMAAADDNNADNSGDSGDSFDLAFGAAAPVVVGAGALASGMPASSDTTDGDVTMDDLNLGWLWDTSSGSC